MNGGLFFTELIVARTFRHRTIYRWTFHRQIRIRFKTAQTESSKVWPSIIRLSSTLLKPKYTFGPGLRPGIEKGGRIRVSSEIRKCFIYKS